MAGRAKVIGAAAATVAGHDSAETGEARPPASGKTWIGGILGGVVKANQERDLKTLAKFIGFYCRHCHPEADRAPVTLKTHDVPALVGKPLALCESCRKLLTHAFVKRAHCPMDPKPMCKKCPNQCYAPAYRAQIREVMKYAGPRLVLRGRLDYLLHLLC